MNPNLVLAQAFVDELAHGGIQEVCIAPGSRSTPLTLAFFHQPGIHVYMHLDERSAAFFALGLSLAQDRPVPMVCTSGSAAANFMPAIVEARMSNVPLLVLTTDRPHELRGSGANQTIDQVKLYADQVLLSVDLPLPEDGQPDLVLRHVRTLAARALHIANGLSKGPVHLNFPFRKPLEPQNDAGFPLSETPASPPFTRTSRGVLTPNAAQIHQLAHLIQEHERGLIICGPRCPGGAFPQAAAALAQASGYPLLAEPLSGLRFDPAVENGWILGGYDTFLAGGTLPWEDPQIILRFGGVPTSAVLCSYLSYIRPLQRIHITESGGWADDDHRTTWLLQVDETLTCARLAEHLAQPRHSAWAGRLRAVEDITWNALHTALEQEELFDAAIVKQVVDNLPAGSRLLIGNSLPVRHLEQFSRPLARQIAVFGNRGASGIDGNISTALGVAASDRERPLVAILGDITFYHDMNGLLAVRQHNLNHVTIIVLNNNCGGIFHRLPVARFEPPFTQAFLTPHNLDFSHAAALYGLEYIRLDSRPELDQALQHLKTTAPAARQPRLIEVRSDAASDLQQRNAALETAFKSIRAYFTQQETSDHDRMENR